MATLPPDSNPLPPVRPLLPQVHGNVLYYIKDRYLRAYDFATQRDNPLISIRRPTNAGMCHGGHGGVQPVVAALARRPLAFFAQVIAPVARNCMHWPRRA